MRTASKYRNKKTQVGIYKFDSIKESKRYLELLWLEKAGEIRDIEVHPKFPIEVNGEKICTYHADFAYKIGSCRVVEDIKSEPTKTPTYRLKKKLMLAVNRIEIVEV